MEGLLLSLNHEKKYGRVDTRNDRLGKLNLYFPNDIVPDLPINSTIEFEVATSRAGRPYARFISLVERNQTIFNSENRDQWYTWGADKEKDFLDNVVPQLGIDLRLNPAKDDTAWAIDFFDYTNNRYADLKTQHTPFFTSRFYYYKGMHYDPTYAVTFDLKDYAKYKAEYPDCDIYFWIHWHQLTYQSLSVQELKGVWRAPFAKMAAQIENGEVARHIYKHRKDDDHNSKESFVFNLADTAIFQKLL